MKMLTIGELSKLANLSTVAIRYYEKQKLIQTPKRSQGGHRLYSEEILTILRFIQNAKNAGFSLDEIKKLLKLQHNTQASSKDVKDFTLNKLTNVRQKIKELKKIQQLLEQLVKQCDGKGGVDCCQILKKLYE